MRCSCIISLLLFCDFSHKNLFIQNVDPT